MMPLSLDRFRRDDDGVAMMTVMLVGAVLMALALVTSDVSMSNLKNAGRDRVAVSAFGVAEAGVQEAMAYLRDEGVDEVADCSPSCTGLPWGNKQNPMVLDFGSGRQARVWVEVKSQLNPPNEKVGRYLVHSEGTSGQGPGLRRVTQEVIAEHYLFPMGVYADHIASNGTPQTFKQSVFSENCIFGREKMKIEGDDLYYGGKAGAVSAKFVSEGSGTCTAGNAKNIHMNGSTPLFCNSKYPTDRDNQGGSTSGTTCNEVDSSYMNLDLLKSSYGGRIPDSILGMLKKKAIAQGNYWTSTNSWTPPNPNTHPDAVLYFDVGANDTVAIQNELNPYDVNPATCTPKRTVIVIVDNATVGSGGLRLQSGARLNGGIFVPNGNLDFRGSTTFTGPLNALTISNWAGSATSQLTECFLNNLPGAMLDIQSERFREVDR